MCENAGVSDPRDHPGPLVVVIGAGFGGLRVARALRRAPVRVLVIDRHNYHTFQPLLYEVAAAGLAPDDVAQPVRAILRGLGNATFRLAEARAVDTERNVVVTDAGEIAYDYLVVSAGSTTNFFGLTSVEQHALTLKDVTQATAIRNRVLRSFERAVVVRDERERSRLMTVAVIGGGPTGVELAGAMAELRRHVLPRDYPELDLSQARVLLLEATGALLPGLPDRLRRKALEQLRALGVDVRLEAPVRDVDGEAVVLASGERIEAANVVWVAGVRAGALAGRMGVELARGGRVPVTPELQLPGHPNVYVIGDLAYLEAPDGTPYPMVAPVAIQQAQTAAENIVRALRGEAPRAFRYRDRGTMATIGRRMAVAHVFGLQFSGFIAWMLWLVVHLLQIVSLRNRALVLLNWAWNYLRYDRANRVVTDGADEGDRPE